MPIIYINAQLTDLILRSNHLEFLSDIGNTCRRSFRSHELVCGACNFTAISPSLFHPSLPADYRSAIKWHESKTNERKRSLNRIIRKFFAIVHCGYRVRNEYVMFLNSLKKSRIFDYLFLENSFRYCRMQRQHIFHCFNIICKSLRTIRLFVSVTFLILNIKKRKHGTFSLPPCYVNRSDNV